MNFGRINYPLPPATLCEVGAWLYGHPTRWQTRLADELGYGRSTIAAWAAGDRDVPKVAVLALRGIVEQRLRKASGGPKGPAVNIFE